MQHIIWQYTSHIRVTTLNTINVTMHQHMYTYTRVTTHTRQPHIDIYITIYEHTMLYEWGVYHMCTHVSNDLTYAWCETHMRHIPCSCSTIHMTHIYSIYLHTYPYYICMCECMMCIVMDDLSHKFSHNLTHHEYT